MRFTRLLLLVFLPLHAFAQTFDFATQLKLTEHPMSIRGAAMGGVSEDDPALNPASLSTLERPLLSLGATRVEYELSGFITPVARDAIAPTHAYVAAPVGEHLALAAHYRAEPKLVGARGIRPDGQGLYDPPCGVDAVHCGYAAIGYGEPIFERDDRRYGVTASWKQGAFALGAGAELHELDEAVTSFGITNVDADLLVTRVRGREIVPNAGVRWQPSPRIALAAAYNGAATFPATVDACNLTAELPYECATMYVQISARRMKTPDTIRASVMVAPLEALVLVAEAVRRNYSAYGDPFHDATEMHVGAEYRVGTVAVRAGWWSDPDRHGIATFPGSVARDHYTVGAGFEVADRARFDVAVDHAAAPALRRVTAGITFGARGR